LLEFALRHAKAHNDLRKIVFIAPYLSILDQTADAIRAALGLDHDPRVLLEHHSLGVERLRRYDSSGELERTQEMLAENWDSPIVVTTNVQFFESLFSNRPSACRKLHRLAGAVLCFDEVQSLPLPVVLPTLAALARLSERYGSTVVFSTATQPAFASLSNALKQRKLGGCEWSPREINTQQREMFHIAQRVEYTWPGPDEARSWSEIADWMLQGPCQALCVLNTKRHAVELFLELNDRPDVHPYHLSTAMCPEHRREVLDKVRHLLDGGVPCLLVSTQCVEAGVDLDFPRVFRALGPLDSIVQAAGRCNRNQRAERGEVRVFRPKPGDSPEYPKDSAYQNAAMLARKYLGRDLNNPEVFSEYYRELYCVQNVEREESELHGAIERKDFEEVAHHYKIIDEDSVNVLVPYGNGLQLAREVRQASLTADWVRRARPYCVNVYRWEVEKYAACFESVRAGYNRQEAEDWRILIGKGTYPAELGIRLTENPFLGVMIDEKQ
jgi:CRISPR/Cas system-associated endonuclease/helicase Cas3